MTPEDKGATRRFDGLASDYKAFRPDYPPMLLQTLAEAIVAAAGSADGLVMDVGAGTGIFTRQLRRALPARLKLVGVEPSSDMRDAAAADDIDYRDGVAEALPCESGFATAIVAATAAHWFDRPAFYREAARAVQPRGVLAIAEYVRDEDNSPVAAGLVDLLGKKGGARAYQRPDYESELRNAAGFGPCTMQRWTVKLQLPPAFFVGLALSSSHARDWIERDGRSSAERELLDMAAPYADAAGAIEFGYVFQLFMTARSYSAE